MSEFKQTVVILRHGDAVDKDVDPERPLSSRGRQQAEVVGAWLARRGVAVGEARHSGKARARQTAELVGKALGLGDGAVRSTDGLAPNDDPGAVAAELETEGTSVALVGHLPHVQRLASLLLAGDGGRVSVEFPAAGAMLLGRDTGAWHLLAFVGADQL